MIFGAGNHWRRLGYTIACIVMLVHGAHASEALTAEDVMAQMRLVRESHANFTERRTMAMLNAPLETKGTLRYEAPDYLVKQTLQPHAEKITVRGELLTIVEGHERLRSLSLSDSPQVTALVESIRGTLAGDLDALERYYQVAVTGSPAAWRLELTPKGEDIAALISSINISGQDGKIRTVDTLEINGDRTIMTVFEDRP